MSLAPENADTLDTLARAASDRIGRTISTSAVLRSVVHLVARGMLPEPAIIEAIEAELETGRRWGTVKQSLPKRAPRARATSA